MQAEIARNKLNAAHVEGQPFAPLQFQKSVEALQGSNLAKAAMEEKGISPSDINIKQAGNVTTGLAQMYGQGIAGAPVEGLPQFTALNIYIFINNKTLSLEELERISKTDKQELWDWHVLQELARDALS